MDLIIALAMMLGMSGQIDQTTTDIKDHTTIEQTDASRTGVVNTNGNL